MRAIASWLLLTLAAIIATIFVGILSVLFANLFAITPVFVAATFTYQYTLYLNRYQECLRVAEYYSVDPAICGVMGEMANNTLKTMTDSALYIQKYGFDNPYVWMLIIVIIVAIVYAVGLIGVQLRNR